MQIDKLTPEQEKLIEANRLKWLDKFFKISPLDFNEELCVSAIKRLYSLANLKEPKVIIVDSPRGCRDKVLELSNNDESLIQFSYYGNASDFGWLALYDTFKKLNVEIDADTLEKFQVIIDLTEAGCFASIQLDEICVVSKYPTVLKVDNENRLHCTSGPAVSFLDGYSQYYVCGRDVDEKTFKECDDLTNARIRFKNETNEDIKSIICFIVRDRYGDQGLLDMLQATLYKESKVKHNDDYTEMLRLYRTKEKFSFLMDSKERPNQPYCWLEYTCPSTGTVYLIDTFADFEDPIEAAKYHRPAPVPFQLPYNWHLFAN